VVFDEFSRILLDFAGVFLGVDLPGRLFFG